MIGTIIWAIVGGAVLGVIARAVMPGKQRIPVWLTIVVGMVAAFLGGLVATWLGVGHTNGIDWIKHIIQLVIAIIGIGVVSAIGGRRR